ncbi:MAG: hypothetical protein GKR89_05000 [Candidatus Latescibacteria bacterium]|nr:hypothetical protein [Candidatus Latescibacterota bacterium]
MLSRAQKQALHEDGYLKIPGAISQVMVQQARRAINHSVGNVGMHPEDLAKMRAQSYCRELTKEPVITDLFNHTPLFTALESLLGPDQVQNAGGGQIALRFPSEPGTDAKPPRGHLDGLGSGLNGSAKGQYNRGFTGLAVVYLADVPQPDSGNFTVWPGSHRFFEDYFKEHGHQVLEQGMPRIDLPSSPVQITGQAGDAVITHHQLVHTAAQNASPDIRYAAIFRVRHKDCESIGRDAYTDIWREWPGVRQAMEEMETA